MLTKPPEFTPVNTILGEYPSQAFLVKREQRVRQSKFVHRSKLLFLQAKKDKKLKVSSSPCPCGRNHFAIKIGEELVCPILFLLGLTILEDEESRRFLEEHSFTELVRRMDPNKDSCFEYVPPDRPYVTPLKIKESL